MLLASDSQDDKRVTTYLKPNFFIWLFFLFPNIQFLGALKNF